MVVGEEIPRVSVLAVVLADRSPLALAEVRTPFLPVDLAFASLVEPGLFSCVHRDLPSPLTAQRWSFYWRVCSRPRIQVCKALTFVTAPFTSGNREPGSPRIRDAVAADFFRRSEAAQRQAESDGNDLAPR